MKNFYKNDWFLRIVSVLVSIVLWVYVVYFQNPEYERWIKNIPLTQSNVSSDFENGKLAIIESSGETVNIKVRGTRKTIAYLNSENINVTADMFGVSKEGKYTLSTGVVFPVDGIEILQKQPYNYEIKVDKVVTVEKKINVDIKGSLKEGYICDTVTKSPEYIKLTGPESYVKKVDNAVITVDLSHNSDDIKGSYKVRLYDGDQEVINEKITKNIEYADVLIKVLMEKSVKVVPDAKNVPENMSFTVSDIKIKGKEAVLTDIFDVSTQSFDASGLKNGDTVKVKLIIPEGAEISGDENAEVTVTVKTS